MSEESVLAGKRSRQKPIPLAAEKQLPIDELSELSEPVDLILVYARAVLRTFPWLMIHDIHLEIESFLRQSYHMLLAPLLMNEDRSNRSKSTIMNAFIADIRKTNRLTVPLETHILVESAATEIANALFELGSTSRINKTDIRNLLFASKPPFPSIVGREITSDINRIVEFGTLDVANSPLYSTKPADKDLLYTLAEFEKLLLPHPDHFVIYKQLVFTQTPLSLLQEQLYGEVLQELGVDSPTVSSGTSTSSAKPPPNPASMTFDIQSLERWGELIFRCALLNREYLTTLKRPTPVGMARLIHETLRDSAATAASSSLETRGSTRTEVQAFSLSSFEQSVSSRLAATVHRNVLNEQDFRAPPLWIAWLKNVHYATMQQFLLEVQVVLTDLRASSNESV